MGGRECDDLCVPVAPTAVPIVVRRHSVRSFCPEIMNIEKLREFCMSMPHATEDVKWGKDLCFAVGEKLFCVCGLEYNNSWQFSFKCTPEKFAELTEIPGIAPAPYVARYHWVAVQDPNVLPDDDIEDLIAKSYMLVFEKLPDAVKRSL